MVALPQNLPPVMVSAIGPERLDDVRELWLALHRYHAEIGSRPLVTDEALSWARRRSQYARWLAADDGFVLLAERSGQFVGYGMVHLQDGPDDSYPLGDRYAEIASLSVMPDERGQGVGSLLLDAIDARLADMGIRDVAVSAMVENDAALRLYRRRGFIPREIMHYRFGIPE